MKKFFVFLLAAATLAGCSTKEDDGGSQGGKDIQLPSGTQTDFNIYADETSGTPAEGISFTTTGPWRATVNGTRADAGTASSWVTVTPDHGDQAGNYTINISLDINTSGEDRSATVTIECGESKINISIEQKGTTADGEVPDEGGEPVSTKLISSIDNALYYIDNNEIKEEFSKKMDFTYDNDGRLIQIDAQELLTTTSGDIEEKNYTVNFTYEDRAVSYKISYKDNSTDTEGGSTALDENGRAVSGEYYIDEKGELYTGNYKLHYNDAGYLIKVTGDGDETIEWTDGNPTKVLWGNSFEMTDEAGYGSMPNVTNLDLNWLLLESEGWDFAVGDATKFFALMGYTGKRSANLAESLTRDISYDGEPQYVHYTYSIETDDDKMPTTITQTTTKAPWLTKPYVSSKYTITYTE